MRYAVVALVAALTVLVVYDLLHEDGYYLIVGIGQSRPMRTIKVRLEAPESPGDAAAVAAKEESGA